MDTLALLLDGFVQCFTLERLLSCVAGVVVGTLTGVLPGIGVTGAMALLLPISFGMDATTALILFAGIYYGAMYGGSTTSILVNLPGEAASVITCLDGNQMAKKGRAGAALAISAWGSFIAGTLGIVALTFTAEKIASLALSFRSPEYFSVCLLGLIILTNLTGKNPMKSLLMVLMGLALGTIGMDDVFGTSRFDFGNMFLMRGIEFGIVAMAVFGINELLGTLLEPQEENIHIEKVKLRELYPNKQEWKRSFTPILRGSVLGFLIGLIPGPAGTLASFSSYALEKKISKHPEEFGHGAIEGVAGPESANNAASSAAAGPALRPALGAVADRLHHPRHPARPHAVHPASGRILEPDCQHVHRQRAAADYQPAHGGRARLAAALPGKDPDARGDGHHLYGRLRHQRHVL